MASSGGRPHALSGVGAARLEWRRFPGGAMICKGFNRLEPCQLSARELEIGAPNNAGRPRINEARA